MNRADSTTGSVGDSLVEWTTTRSRTFDGRTWWVEITWKTEGGRALASAVTLHAPSGREVTTDAWRNAVPIREAIEAGRIESAARIAEQAQHAPTAPTRDDDGERVPTTGDLARAAQAVASTPEPTRRGPVWDYDRIASLYNEAILTGRGAQPVRYVRQQLARDYDGHDLTPADHARLRAAVERVRKKGLLLPNPRSTNNERRNDG